MALQINPNVGAPLADGASGKPDNASVGTPNQDAANQFADLLKNPTQEGSTAAKTPTPSPFGSPFKTTKNTDQATPAADGQTTAPQSGTSSTAKENVGNFPAGNAGAGVAPPANTNSADNQTSMSGDAPAAQTPSSSTSSGLATTPFKTAQNTNQQNTSSTADQAFLSQSGTSFTVKENVGNFPSGNGGASVATATNANSAGSANSDMQDSSAFNTAASSTSSFTTSTSAQAATMPNSSMSSSTSGVGGSTSPDFSSEIKDSVKPNSDALSDAQLAAAASMTAAVGVQPSATPGAVNATEEVSQPHVDGEKIEAMMKSVTKELGMRDLSQLKLGGEMTLKLDQGALPNTEVKVRFEGNEMVISIDSKTDQVNSFCTDNLALLQQSVNSGMKEEMKVRIEVRNPPDQPNQRKDEQGGQGKGGQGGQGSQGGNSGQSSQQQSNGTTDGDSLAD